MVTVTRGAPFDCEIGRPFWDLGDPVAKRRQDFERGGAHQHHEVQLGAVAAKMANLKIIAPQRLTGIMREIAGELPLHLAPDELRELEQRDTSNERFGEIVRVVVRRCQSEARA